MKILIDERLSEHRCKTPEGYLICIDAILARTGKQTYRKNEIFKDSDDETEIEIDRTEDEVFSPQTLASFENKPVTVEHPDEDVNVHNYKEYAVGFVRDVHRGVVNGQPVILGNLVITDEKTIQEIENGEHTDLSCGYDCDIVDEPNPCQRNIRGNHVALCECGRAGIARIVDSKCKDEQLYAVEFSYDGDSWSNYLGHVNVRAKSEQDALAKAKRWAVERYDNPGFFKIASTKYTNVETIDAIKDAKFDVARGPAQFIDESPVYDAQATISGESERYGDKFYGYMHVEHPRLGSFYVSYKHKRNKKEVQLDGTPWNFIKAKGYTDEQKKWIIQHKQALENVKPITSTIADRQSHNNVDSVYDALIPPTKEAINKFESLLRIFDIKIDRKGLTPFGRVHYQVRASMEFDRFVNRLNRIDAEMGDLGIPMTFNAGSDGKTCTAGIDLDKQYVKDSKFRNH